MRKPLGAFPWVRGEWLFLVGVVLIVVFGAGLSREIVRRRAVVSELADLRQEIRSLNDRRAELTQLIQDVQSAATQEREARTKLNLAKPGERALIIERSGRANEAAGTVATATSDTASPAAANPTRWWNYFFGT